LMEEIFLTGKSKCCWG